MYLKLIAACLRDRAEVSFVYFALALVYRVGKVDFARVAEANSMWRPVLWCRVRYKVLIGSVELCERAVHPRDEDPCMTKACGKSHSSNRTTDTDPLLRPELAMPVGSRLLYSALGM